MLSEANRLALLAKNTEQVARLVEGHLLSIVSTSELSTLNRMLVSLPEITINGPPWLALAMAWGAAYIGQLRSVETLLDKAESTLASFGSATHDRVKGRILVLKSYLAGSKREYLSSIQTAQDACGYLPENDL